ncbi:MAG: MinD/ParA family protein [Desulfobacterales bacterium]|nr:MinD/ParA family protein [Desulfobacterales bacterium]
MDQATTLRTLAGDCKPELQPRADSKLASVISVTSGKGGVGKTAVVANIALVQARQGRRVMIIDADLGLANIDVVFGLNPRFNLNHFFSGEKTLEEIVIEGPFGIKILAAGSGVQSFTHLSAPQKQRFLESMDVFHGLFDLMLIDTEAGISENVTYFNVAAQEILVVTTSDPTAITDAYALMKVLSKQYHEKRFNLIANQVKDQDEALEIYKKLTMVSGRYLDISIDFLGWIPYERRMRETISRQRVIADLFPGTRASRNFEEIARQLDSLLRNGCPKGTTQLFWKRLMEFE